MATAMSQTKPQTKPAKTDRFNTLIRPPISPLLPQARGWASDLSAGVDGDGYSQNSGCYLFGVSITLTDAGLHAGPGFGLAAVELLFHYLSMLRHRGGWAGVRDRAALLATGGPPIRFLGVSST